MTPSMNSSVSFEANVVNKVPDFVDPGFAIVVDTREQAPWSFQSVKCDKNVKGDVYAVRTIKDTLDPGDYSIAGHESTVSIERKSKSDLFHCVGTDRERFERQVQRLNELPHAFVVVEADWSSILAGDSHSALPGKTVFRTVASWQIRYPSVHWWLCPSRGFAEKTAFRIFQRFHALKGDS